MSKKTIILELYAQMVGTMPEHNLPKAIAERVGTTDSYVRTVARQRMGRGSCEAERRYRLSPLGRLTRRRRWKAYIARIKSDPIRHEELKEKWRREHRKRAEASASA
jgi:hypothetical protein